MDTIFNQDEDEYEEMTLNSEPSNLDPPNTCHVTDSGNKMEAEEKLLKYYYDAKIYHNHTKFSMIRKKVK